MKIQKYNKKGLVWYSVNGDLDLYTAMDLKEIIEKDIKNSMKKLVLDLHECQFIDSSGIGVIIKINQEIKKLKGILILFKLQDNINNLFNKTKLFPYFNIAKNDSDIDKLIKQ